MKRIQTRIAAEWKTFFADALPSDNGQGLDVWTSLGGYNCVHYWTPVLGDLPDPGKPGVRGKPVEGLAMFAGFEQFAHGVTPQTEALYARGFGEFTTFESSGVFGVNRTNWTQAFTTGSKSERRVMIKERQTANMLASLGNEALLAPAMKNLAGGPADLLLNGAATEIKTPQSFTPRTLERQFTPKQSDNFVIRLDKPLPDAPWAKEKLQRRLRAYPHKRVWLLHAYAQQPYLEEIRP